MLSCVKNEGGGDYMSFLKNYPIPIAGLILSIFALGNLLQSYGDNVRLAVGAIGFLLLIPFVLKLIVMNKSLKEDFQNPVVASVFLTFTMALICFAGYVKIFFNSTGLAIWYFGTILHIILLVWFSAKYLLNFSIKKVFPSWFIVYVGVAVASVTSASMQQSLAGQITFYLAFVLYFCILPFVCYRVWKVKEIPEPAKPTLIILSAPASLLLAGYLTAFPHKNSIILWLLITLSFTFYIIALCYLPGLLRLKFTPGYSAFTFPLVISAIATKMLNIYFKKSYITLNIISQIEEGVAILIVAWVLVCYLFFLAKKR